VSLSNRNRGRLSVAMWLLGLVGVAALVWFAIQSLMTPSGPTRKHTVHQLTVMKPPPPPPPPPKQEPLPEMKKEEVKIDTPAPPPDTPQAAEAPPAGAALGLDAEGTAGGDSFGLQANRGGRDLLTLGSGTEGGSGRFTGFASRLQRHLQNELARNAALRQGEYRAEIKVWVSGEGAIERIELANPTGNPKTDEQLRQALGELPRLSERPPDNMPQPIRLRITSRTAG